MKIRVNKSEIKRIGKKLSSNANDLHNEGQKINSIINEMAGYWEGEDRDRCVSLVKDTYLVNLERFKQKIDAYGNYLGEVPNVYDQLDNSYMKRKIK
jgi:uncharacterized protein YukE